jgi:lipopolysaccharide transport system permease protein
MNETSTKWDLVIRRQRGWWDIDFGALWAYRDLIWLFVQRDFVTFYKQTILGPAWYIIQPVFSTVVFTVIFGQIAGISTDGTPAFLFYMAGNVCWSYFSTSLTKTSNTFVGNANVFGKVYFPRMTVPIATIIIGFAQFAIQLALFLGFYAYFYFTGSKIEIHISILALPLLLLQMALLGLGAGILISSLTTKYRDLVFAMTFGVQLWMYATPVVYPASIIPKKYLGIYMLNPMAPIVEQFRLMFLGASAVTIEHVVVGWLITLALFVASLLMFYRVERNFMDTV